ncbi:MAG: hypothetical protein IJR25_07570 [Bacteroidales bacterium]|nr:hypothetical protein [Bacteroidales bacterium]
MKSTKILAAILAMFICATTLGAQTAEEILQKMSEQLARADAEGFAMDLNMKLPIIGWVKTHSLMRGDKMRVEISGNDKTSVAWTDLVTQWEYNAQTNEITITKRDAAKKDDNSDLSTFGDIADGYDLSITKETADVWYILCKRSKGNKDKDAPKKMDLAVAKATYLPVYLKLKKSILEMSMENVTLGVSEASVTFNAAEFPTATIVDKR